MATEDDYTEERLAEYDAAAIAQDDVIVMGFVTVVRGLRARLATAENALAAVRAMRPTVMGSASPTHKGFRPMMAALDAYDVQRANDAPK
jgi:hypothetical protein